MADSTPGFMPTSASLEAFHFLDRLRSERGAVGVLFGPPGTGKSAILRHRLVGQVRLVDHDQPETLRELVVRTGAALALAGPEPELRRRLRRVPDLEHRVGRFRRLRALDLEEVDDAVSRASGLRLARAERDDLVRALHRRSGGNWRILLRLARRCAEESRANYRPRLEPATLSRAFQDTGLQAEAA